MSLLASHQLRRAILEALCQTRWCMETTKSASYCRCQTIPTSPGCACTAQSQLVQLPKPPSFMRDGHACSVSDAYHNGTLIITGNKQAALEPVEGMSNKQLSYVGYRCTRTTAAHGSFHKLQRHTNSHRVTFAFKIAQSISDERAHFRPRSWLRSQLGKALLCQWTLVDLATRPEREIR